MTHEGEEMFYILDGAVTVEVDGKRTVLEAGNSVHFPSTLKHSIWNHTTSPRRFCRSARWTCSGTERRGPGRSQRGRVAGDRPQARNKASKTKKGKTS